MTTHGLTLGQRMNPEATLSLLEFGTDVALRSRWFVPASFQHPAKLHLGLLRWIIERYTKPCETIADPMAGSGSVLYAATMQRHVIAREIEPRWLALLRENAAHITAQAGLFAGCIDIGQADARNPWGYQADHIICRLFGIFSYGTCTHLVQFFDLCMKTFTPVSDFGSLQSKSPIFSPRQLTQPLNQQFGDARFSWAKARFFIWQCQEDSLHYSLIDAISWRVSQHFRCLFCRYQLHFLPARKFALKPVRRLQHCTLFGLLQLYQQFCLATLNTQIGQQQFGQAASWPICSLELIQHSPIGFIRFAYSHASAEGFFQKIGNLRRYLPQSNLRAVVGIDSVTQCPLMVSRFLYGKVAICIHRSSQVCQYMRVHMVFPSQYAMLRSLYQKEEILL